MEVARQIEDVPILHALLSRVQGATGDVEGVAHVVGNPDEKTGLSLVDVDLRLRHAGFRSAPLPLDVREVQAHIHVSPTVRIERLEGQVGPAAFDAGGELTWTGSEFSSDVTISMVADAANAWSWIANAVEVGPRPDVERVVRMQATVTGRGR
ncbi:MAG: hypothetical protein IPO99_00320 [Nitrospira sp.]|nr:hypothetical protein [Nitrospira sp.]